MALRFRNRTASARRKDAALDLMIQVRAVFGLDGDTVVSVSEPDCAGSGCCGAQTVILVMRPDQPTEAIRIDKPLETVTSADLFDAAPR
jgi:hypothetical protein